MFCFRKALAILSLAALFACRSVPQPPSNSEKYIKIVEAEDMRRWDDALAALFDDSNETVRKRAVMAAGRIGNAAAIPALTKQLAADGMAETAAFALGEIESPAAVYALLGKLRDSKSNAVRARIIEALGKISASLPESANDQKKQIGSAIVETLRAEAQAPAPSRDVVLLGETAVLRAKPEAGPAALALFLDSSDARVRADALNALARVRAKESLELVRTMLAKDADPIVRANAARALGAAQDASAVNALISAATTDADSRVRVAAIRALAGVGKKEVASALITRGQAVRGDPNEVLEVATTLGTLLRGSNDAAATAFLRELRKDGVGPVEVEMAYARISPAAFLRDASAARPARTWQDVSAIAQGLGEIAPSKDLPARTAAELTVRLLLTNSNTPERAVPDLLHALQAFKPNGLVEIARNHLKASDVIVRASAADILAELPPSDETSRALAAALPQALTEKMDDAARSIVTALGKANDDVAKTALKQALQGGDYIVRQQAATLLKADAGLANTRNTRADYERAVARFGKSVSAVINTDEGKITIQLLPDDAPLTVDSFIALARAHFFDGLTFHRVVPNFVIQGGDPRGDGNGGPDYQLRCEINMVPYDRGAVGMALSGKDTGGSQFFITHSPQPHLDGGYTVFGRVTDGMDVVDRIARDDRIQSVEIKEN